MERESFGARARKTIWRDTWASVKKRTIPLIVGLIGVALGGLYSWLALHRQVVENVKIGLIAGAGANVIWFLCVLIYNTVRVPWLLDAESDQLIDQMESRAEAAEIKVASIERTAKENRQLQDLFSRLIQAGIEFSSQLIECSTLAHFSSWDRHYKTWIESIQNAMRDMGFPADAAEFIRAGEYAEPVKGFMNIGNEREQRCRVLEKYQEKLAEFVKRRLP